MYSAGLMTSLIKRLVTSRWAGVDHQSFAIFSPKATLPDKGGQRGLRMQRRRGNGDDDADGGVDDHR